MKNGLEQLDVLLKDLRERATNLQPALQEYGNYQVGSFQENFRVGGRPEWSPSKRVLKHGGQTLIINHFLERSVTHFDVVENGIVFGSNLPYAAIQQFGGTIHRRSQRILFRTTEKGKNRFASAKYAANRKTGAIRFSRTKEYDIVIEPRPFIVFQPKDIEKAAEILGKYLMRGNS